MNKSITRKITLTFILAFCIPLILFNSIWYVFRVRLIRDTFDIQVTNAMLAIQSEINHRVSELASISRTITNNMLIVNYLQNYSSDPQYYFLSAMWDLGPFISNISEINPIIETLRIYSFDLSIPRYQNIIYPLDVIMEQPWISKLAAMPYNDYFLFHSQHLYEAQTKQNVHKLLYPSGQENPRVFSLFRHIYSAKTQDTIAYLELITDINDLLSTADITSIDASIFFWEESTGIVYAVNDQFQLESQIEQAVLEKQIDCNEAWLGKNKYYMRTLELTEPELLVIFACPFESVTATARGEILFIQITILLSTLLFLVFLILMFRSIPKRLRLLVANMEQLRGGKTDVVMEDNYNDEISQVSQTLTLLLEHIKSLINTVYQVELAEKDATLAYLRAQMDPHFLFNSLEAIRMMATLGKHERVADALVALSSILRVRLKSNDKITLYEELIVVQSYVQVENVRYDDRILLTISCEDALTNIMIPSLIIQPLVENAIRHAMRIDRYHLLIKLEISELESGLMQIRVTDDGGGMSYQRLEEVVNSIGNGTQSESKDGSGVGLVNISKRLKLYYRENAHLQIESISNGGTQIEMIIPLT